MITFRNYSNGAAYTPETITFGAYKNGTIDTAFPAAMWSSWGGTTGRLLVYGTIPTTYMPGDIVNLFVNVSVSGVADCIPLDTFIMDGIRVRYVDPVYGSSTNAGLYFATNDSLGPFSSLSQAFSNLGYQDGEVRVKCSNTSLVYPLGVCVPESNDGYGRSRTLKVRGYDTYSGKRSTPTIFAGIIYPHGNWSQVGNSITFSTPCTQSNQPTGLYACNPEFLSLTRGQGGLPALRRASTTGEVNSNAGNSGFYYLDTGNQLLYASLPNSVTSYFASSGDIAFQTSNYSVQVIGGTELHLENLQVWGGIMVQYGGKLYLSNVENYFSNASGTAGITVNNGGFVKGENVGVFYCASDGINAHGNSRVSLKNVQVAHVGTSYSDQCLTAHEYSTVDIENGLFRDSKGQVICCINGSKLWMKDFIVDSCGTTLDAQNLPLGGIDLDGETTAQLKNGVIRNCAVGLRVATRDANWRADASIYLSDVDFINNTVDIDATSTKSEVTLANCKYSTVAPLGTNFTTLNSRTVYVDASGRAPSYNSNIWYIDPVNGNDSNHGHTKDMAISGYIKLMNSVGYGDTIIQMTGYIDTILGPHINLASKSLHWQGIDSNNCYIRTSSVYSVLLGNDCSISNVTVLATSTTANGVGGIGIYASGIKGVSINNVNSSGVLAGLWCNHVSGVNIKDSTIIGSYYGAILYHTPSYNLDSCIIKSLAQDQYTLTEGISLFVTSDYLSNVSDNNGVARNCKISATRATGTSNSKMYAVVCGGIGTFEDCDISASSAYSGGTICGVKITQDSDRCAVNLRGGSIFVTGAATGYDLSNNNSYSTMIVDNLNYDTNKIEGTITVSDIETVLNTAIPGNVTADSIYDRIKTMDITNINGTNASGLIEGIVSTYTSGITVDLSTVDVTSIKGRDAEDVIDERIEMGLGMALPVNFADMTIDNKGRVDISMIGGEVAENVIDTIVHDRLNSEIPDFPIKDSIYDTVKELSEVLPTSTISNFDPSSTRVVLDKRGIL
jgi:hypothetical protein